MNDETAKIVGILALLGSFLLGTICGYVVGEVKTTIRTLLMRKR